ncbi:MAG: hypothetical protein QXT37_11695 [Thermofilaceae archaeon]
MATFTLYMWGSRRGDWRLCTTILAIQSALGALTLLLAQLAGGAGQHGFLAAAAALLTATLIEGFYITPPPAPDQPPKSPESGGTRG